MESWKDWLLQKASELEHKFDEQKLKIKHNLNLIDPLKIQAYRGYGNQEKMVILGRLVEESGIDTPKADDSYLQNAVTLFHRYESDEIPGAEILVEAAGYQKRGITSQEGYFQIEIEGDFANQENLLPYTATLTKSEYAEDARKVEAKGHVVLPTKNKQGIISDLDDTVVVSQATNFLEKSKILLINNEHTRKPFAGVGAFYRALTGNNWEQPNKPVFYVSSSSWNLYDMFYSFCKVNKLPQGCFLLRDVGLDENKFYRSSHGSHKLEKIKDVLKTFHDTSFIFIGDSGQHDPEIYRDLSKEYANQMDVIYIRDVKPDVDDKRDREVKEIAKECEAAGVPMILVSDSLQAAQDAVSRGYMAEQSLPEIRQEVKQDESEAEQQGSDILSFLGIKS
jgi:phosphatidate phosphatase APP1